MLELLFLFCWPHLFSFVGHTFSLLLVLHFFLFCWTGIPYLQHLRNGGLRDWEMLAQQKRKKWWTKKREIWPANENKCGQQKRKSSPNTNSFKLLGVKNCGEKIFGGPDSFGPTKEDKVYCFKSVVYLSACTYTLNTIVWQELAMEYTRGAFQDV